MSTELVTRTKESGACQTLVRGLSEACQTRITPDSLMNRIIYSTEGLVAKHLKHATDATRNS